jgi:hypothetical protein
MRGGMSPGISAFVADNGGLLASTYQVGRWEAAGRGHIRVHTVPTWVMMILSWRYA